MRRIFVGPFSRFAYEETDRGFLVYDAEAGTPAPVVATCATDTEARAYIEHSIATDPTMRDDHA